MSTVASVAFDVDKDAATSLFFSIFAALCALYPVLAPFVKTQRQAAWILTSISSAAMTAASTPFVRDYVHAGYDVAGVRPRGVHAVAVNRFFQAYLAADLTVGFICYRSQISFLAGWAHHLVYLGVNELAIRQGWAHIFCLAAVMELPTFLLGIGTLVPKLRCDRLFATAFFVTRIVFHLVLIYAYSLPANRPSGSLIPVIIPIIAFPLHAMWFYGCVRGILRRSVARTQNVHPLSPDAHPDARSPTRHAASLGTVVSPWEVTLRLRRMRARVGRWVRDREPGAVAWVRDGGVRQWVSERGRRPMHPRVVARRMSERLINALPEIPSTEAILQYVGLVQ